MWAQIGPGLTFQRPQKLFLLRSPCLHLRPPLLSTVSQTIPEQPVGSLEDDWRIKEGWRRTWSRLEPWPIPLLAGSSLSCLAEQASSEQELLTVEKEEGRRKVDELVGGLR